MSAGVAAATLLVPGIGAVFALGFGAAALLGLVGVGAGAAVGKSVSQDSSAPQPTPDEKSSEDVAFFREVLKEGRSLIVSAPIRTRSRQRPAPSSTAWVLACKVAPRSKCRPRPGKWTA
ncbi:MAG: hypothetical protein ACLQU2_20945 [Candidatus Binataceae bacterium]